jgi:Fe-S-cluster containining protein
MAKKPWKKGKKKNPYNAKNPCFSCGAECCRYFAVYIEEPTDLDEYDAVKWYLHHKKVCVYIDKEEDWYVHVDNVCKQLGKGGDTCKIYNSRPDVCRNYEPGQCESADIDVGNIAEFYSVEGLEEFFELNYRVVGDDVKRRRKKLRKLEEEKS